MDLIEEYLALPTELKLTICYMCRMLIKYELIEAENNAIRNRYMMYKKKYYQLKKIEK